MGVYIKGMEMPTSCLECPLTDGHSASCLITEKSVYFSIDKRHDDCPLVPVPPHGRLIDADALTDAMESTEWYHQAETKDMVHGANSAEHQAWYKEQDVYSAITNAPTIIEAEDDRLRTNKRTSAAQN